MGKKRRKKRNAVYPSNVDPRLFSRAQRLRQEVTSAEYVKGADDLDPALVPVREVLTELIWGKVWLRPGIDRRTRSFMNIALLMALNRPDELVANFKVAGKNGLSRNDIAEAILHAAAYCGGPAGVNTVALARRFFQEEDARRAGAKVRTKRR
jgi:4-carboxymuconolactone decarboxylase